MEAVDRKLVKKKERESERERASEREREIEGSLASVSKTLDFPNRKDSRNAGTASTAAKIKIPATKSGVRQYQKTLKSIPSETPTLSSCLK